MNLIEKMMLLLFALILQLSASAQELSVAKMETLSMDTYASVHRRNDLNGNACAVVRVSLTVGGATFGGNVVGDVLRDGSDYIVYMPAGSKKLWVKHPAYHELEVNFSSYDISKLQGLTTYRITINAPQVYGVQQDDGMTYFSMTVSPVNAQVTLDGKPVLLDADGTLIQRLIRGQHSYSVSSAGYSTVTQNFTLGTERQNVTVNLESELATLSISATTPGTEIYVNDQRKGTNSWSGQLMPGNYVVEGRQKGYHDYRQTITLTERQKKEVSIPTLAGRTGQLDVAYKPIDAEVWLDGKKLGASPDVFKNILVGSHKVSINKNGYKTKDVTVTINEGQATSISGTLESIASTAVTNTAIVATDYEWVDLGLSVKWATCNVGAAKPEEYGDYYAWGETETKTDYSWKTYIDSPNKDGYSFTKYAIDKKTILDPEDDVAHVRWGGSWRMPTKSEQDELRDKCKWTWTTRHGIKGYNVTGPNGNLIFLPATGYRHHSGLGDVGSYGIYRSSSLDLDDSGRACYLCFGSSGVDWDHDGRYYGLTVRPVCP